MKLAVKVHNGNSSMAAEGNKVKTEVTAVFVKISVGVDLDKLK
ncbi:hypothetical protein [Pseudoalteromonas sp. MMG005]|nr:hypothetical protein [Pseudoalteromonas sp. MMG005]